MKKALVTCALFLTICSAFAQSPADGQFTFKTVGIQTASGLGTYNVPLYANNGSEEVPAGLVPGGFTVGLFLPGSSNPFVTGQLGTSANTAPYVVTPAVSQTVSVPGQPVGSTPTIIVRAWATASGSFFAAQVGWQWGEWVINSKPLGGTLPDGSQITPPSLTGWGNENGSGFVIDTPEPPAIALVVLGIGALAPSRRRK